MATISLVCIIERQRGTAFTAAALALERLLMLTAGAPVLGPAQENVGCRLKYWASKNQMYSPLSSMLPFAAAGPSTQSMVTTSPTANLVPSATGTLVVPIHAFPVTAVTR